MSFSKFSQYGRFACNQHYALRCLPENIAEEFIENYQFIRRSDFLPAWDDWKRIVCEYYSFDAGLFTDLCVSKHITEYDFHYSAGPNTRAFGLASSFEERYKYWRAFPTKICKTILSEIKYSNRLYYPGDFDILLDDETCECGKNYFREYYREEVDPDVSYSGLYPYECNSKHEHMMNLYIPLIMRMIDKSRRSIRRFYKRLIRIIYVLSEDRIDWEVIENLIFNPPLNTPRNLLKYLYERHYFEIFTKSTLEKIPFWFEANKHFRAYEQSGGSQSVSATLFHELAVLVSKHPQEQMGINHKLIIAEKDELFARFETTLMKTQESFFEALKGSMVEGANYMMTLFLIVGTVALLGYSLAKLGSSIIIRSLNIMYKLVCGNLFAGDKIVQQSDEGGISIPFLPAMIMNNVIAPPKETLTRLWNDPQVDKVMRRIGYIGDPKIHRGLSTMTDWVKDMINATVEWFMKEVLGIDVAENIDSVSSPIENWYNDCDNFLRDYWAKELEWNDINWSILMNLYGRGMSLTRQKVFDPYKHNVWKILFQLGNILEKFTTHGRTGSSVRNPPVTIYMAGGTGVGKSSVTYPLAAEILKGIFQKEKSAIDLKTYWKNLIYMRSAEQEFWDGYENQLVTVFDDFGQMVDSTGNPNTELFEVIRASNSFPYPLHMASLDQKATTTFNSKIILVSSNLEQPKTMSLNFPEALWRRFDLSIIVSRKPGAVVVPGKFDPNIYNFRRYDMSTQAAGEYMTYKEVVFYAVTEYFKRKGFVDSMDDYIQRTFAEENPIQQGMATFAGNVVCASKGLIKATKRFVEHSYRDFRCACSGEMLMREREILKEVLHGLGKRMYEVRKAWEKFKMDHPYIYKAIRFVGILSVVLGVLRLYNSFTQQEKKTKVMNMEQFIKGGPSLPDICDEKDTCRYRREINRIPALKPEAYAQVNVAPLKVEAYNGTVDKPLKVESYSVGIDKPLKVEGYNEAKIQQLKAEGLCYNIVCPHELAADSSLIFKTTFLKACDDSCPNLLQSESVQDINANEILGKVLKHNYYKLYMSHNSEAIGHGIFLRGRIFMCPKHYINIFRKMDSIDGSIYFRNAFLNRSFEIKVSEILKYSKGLDSPDDGETPVFTRDIMAFPVSTANFHANAEPFFASRTSLSYVLKSQVLLPVLMEGEGRNPLPFVGFHFTNGQSGLTTRETAVIATQAGVNVRKMRDLWEYSMDTKETYCGAPLIVRNVHIAPGKIIGMHVAGLPNTGLGFSTPVYKEDVQRLLSFFNSFDSVEFRRETKVEEYPTEQAQVPEEAEFIRVGAVQRGVAQPSKSKIIPSPIYNKVREPVTKPCALRPTMVDGKLFDPREYRLKRLGNYPVTVDSEIVAKARLAVIDELSEQIPRVDCGLNIKSVYTFEEAVAGIDGEPYINSIKRNTSPGYPYVHMKGFSNRKEIFGDEEKCDLERTQSKILQSRVERIINLARQGIAVDHIFMDTLKDERKPIHKAHKTRLFSAGPIDYLIACKQYFNGIVAVLQKSRNICHVSVGTDHNTQDWGVIVRELQRKSLHMVAGDFEGFDASQSMPLLEAAGDILIQLSKKFCGTTDEEANIMKILLIGLFNSTHITDKEIYQWTHSLPSGHYLTAIINSIFVLLVFCICWMSSHRSYKYITARSFFHKCGIVAYGDDHIVSIPYSSLEIFNQKTIPVFMSEIGLGYTMEDKDREVDILSRPIEDVTYLKRSFRFDEGRQQWIAPISLDTVLESPMWLHKCPDKVTQMVVQLESQLRELSLHDSGTWEKWASVFADLGKQFGHYTNYVYQEETRAEVLGQ
nr:MAG: hypothetical protein 1 [Triatovirus sp.]